MSRDWNCLRDYMFMTIVVYIHSLSLSPPALVLAPICIPSLAPSRTSSPRRRPSHASLVLAPSRTSSPRRRRSHASLVLAPSRTSSPRRRPSHASLVLALSRTSSPRRRRSHASPPRVMSVTYLRA